MMMGTRVEVGIPAWIKELMGGAYPGITQKVVVTFENNHPALLLIECIGKEITSDPLASVYYMRVDKEVTG